MGMLSYPYSELQIFSIFVDKQNDISIFSNRIDSRVKFEGGVYPDFVKQILLENIKNKKGNCKRRAELEAAIEKSQLIKKSVTEVCLLCFKKVTSPERMRDHPFFENVICIKCYGSRRLVLYLSDYN